MLSRVADNLYWFGRYIQRAENTARLINVNASLILDLPPGVSLGWAPLIDIVGSNAEFYKHYSEATEENVVRFLTIDPRNPGSIFVGLNNAREILRVSRDTIPREVWEQLNDLYLYVADHGEDALTGGRRADFLSLVIGGMLKLYGTLTASMSRDVGYQFLRIGTNIEQADMTTRILDVRTLALAQEKDDRLSPFNNVQWMSVLRSLAAYQMYRRNVRARVSGVGVLRFLLQNREFPRSVMFCLDMIAGTLPHLPSNRKIERAIERSRALIRDANIPALLASPNGVPELMDEIQIGLGELHNAVAEAYFSG